MRDQHTPGPWEKYRDSDGLFAICSGPDTVVCRGIRNKADADLIVESINGLQRPSEDVLEVEGKTSPLTSNQLVVLEWFSTRDWVPHREWIREMTTRTPRSLCNRGLLDVDHSKTTTHYRINDAGRAILAPTSKVPT